MSRIGKKPIAVPDNTGVTVKDSTITVKGPKGEISRTFKPVVTISVEDGEVTLQPVNDTRLARALWGTYSSHISNMIQGVNEEYEKKLIVEGVGFRSELRGSTLVLTVGFSHDVEMEVPDGLDVTVEKNEITVRGIDKDLVGQFAANVRAVKKPEPYKGKGIRYSDEVVRIKEGKKAV